MLIEENSKSKQTVLLKILLAHAYVSIVVTACYNGVAMNETERTSFRNISKTIRTGISDKLSKLRFGGRLIDAFFKGFFSKDTNDFYTKISDKYDRIFSKDFFIAQEIVNTYFSDGGERALDCACGTGLSVFPLAAKFRSTIGIDINRSMLAEAKKAINKYSLQLEEASIQYTQGDITHLPYPDNFFDAVTCVGAIWHLHPDQEIPFFNEIHRVLRPSGKVIITAMIGDSPLEQKIASLWDMTPLNQKVQLGKFTGGYIFSQMEQHGFIPSMGEITISDTSLPVVIGEPIKNA